MIGLYLGDGEYEKPNQISRVEGFWLNELTNELNIILAKTKQCKEHRSLSEGLFGKGIQGNLTKV